ncbi:MAG: nucleotidyltransferase family protein [bacterium]
MQRLSRLNIQNDKIVEFCQRNYIRKLSLFGSILRDDFGHTSDIDVLVEFKAGNIPGFIRLEGIEDELSKIIGGRRVDMNTPKSLSKYFRDEVMANSKVLYAEG